MSDRDWLYATKPTGITLFLRTFLPYQIWRFIWLNWSGYRSGVAASRVVAAG